MKVSDRYVLGRVRFREMYSLPRCLIKLRRWDLPTSDRDIATSMLNFRTSEQQAHFVYYC